MGLGPTGFERIKGVPLRLIRSEPRPCPYLPDRTASDLFTFPGLTPIDAPFYEFLMDRGFRRSGYFFYRPMCPECRACVPTRVPVDRFAPSRSQRRALRKNADLECVAGPLSADDEQFELYQNYQAARHSDRPPGTREDFERFLHESPIDSMQLEFRAAGRLIGVSILDVCPNSLSSVYFFFDPAESDRSLGIFSALMEMAECRRRGLAYWYVGFYVEGCRKMAYKTAFRPFEMLDMDALSRGEVKWIEGQ